MATGKVLAVATDNPETRSHGPPTHFRYASHVLDQVNDHSISRATLFQEDAVRANVDLELQNIEITGVDFYGLGNENVLWGNDGQPLLTNLPGDNNTGLVSGKGVDILAVAGAGSLGRALIDAGALFVLGYIDEVFLLLTPEDMEAMTTAKYRLYDGSTCTEAYQAQILAMQNRIDGWSRIAPDFCSLMRANLARYRLLLNPSVPGSSKARWYRT